MDYYAYLAASNQKQKTMAENRRTLFLPPEEYDRLKAAYPKFNEPWQTDEMEELKSMAADKVPLAEMSSQLGRTVNSLKMKLKSLGLYEPRPAPRPWEDGDEKLLVQMYNDGVPFEEMAEHFGRTQGAIVSRLVKLRVNLFNPII